LLTIVTLLMFGLLCGTVLMRAGEANGGPVKPCSIVIKAIVVLLLLGLGIRQPVPPKLQGNSTSLACRRNCRPPSFRSSSA
jgi:hypothetical protein